MTNNNNNHTTAPFPVMTTSRDVPNPLRPYYVPPSIGLSPDAAGSNLTLSSISTRHPQASTASASAIGSSARDMFPDFDYGGPLFDTDTPSVGDMAKKIMDQALWKYTSVLLAQPFDVAKTILQVRLASNETDITKDLKRRQSMRCTDSYYTEQETSGTESDQDEPSYFTPTKPSRTEQSSRKSRSLQSRSRQSRSRQSRSSQSTSRRRTPPSPSSSASASASSRHPHRLIIRRPDSVMDALSQLWQHSGATGLWKATNASFIYNVLVKALETWTRSLLSALANLPDPAALSSNSTDAIAGAMGALDIADSPSPLTSLAIAVASAAIAGVLLAPLDLVRIRLILTPTSHQPRAIVPILRRLPSLAVTTSLLPVTLLHSSLPTLIATSCPLILRQYLHIDPLTTPTTYSLATFLASASELFLKLPFETVLRRGQVSVLRHHHTRAYSYAQHTSLRPSSSSSNTTPSSPDLETVVEPGPYKGLLGTMWYIAKEEGVRESPLRSITSTPAKPGPLNPQRKQKKGQGVAGLWRGWRVGMWGLVGVWGASALGSAGKTEF